MSFKTKLGRDLPTVTVERVRQVHDAPPAFLALAAVELTVGLDVERPDSPPERHVRRRGGRHAAEQNEVVGFQGDLGLRLLDEVRFGEIVAGVAFVSHLDHVPVFEAFRMRAFRRAPPNARLVQPPGKPLEVAVAQNRLGVKLDLFYVRKKLEAVLLHRRNDVVPQVHDFEAAEAAAKGRAADRFYFGCR